MQSLKLLTSTQLFGVWLVFDKWLSTLHITAMCTFAAQIQTLSCYSILKMHPQFHILQFLQFTHPNTGFSSVQPVSLTGLQFTVVFQTLFLAVRKVFDMCAQLIYMIVNFRFVIVCIAENSNSSHFHFFASIADLART